MKLAILVLLGLLIGQPATASVTHGALTKEQARSIVSHKTFLLTRENALISADIIRKVFSSEVSISLREALPINMVELLEGSSKSEKKSINDLKRGKPVNTSLGVLRLFEIMDKKNITIIDVQMKSMLPIPRSMYDGVAWSTCSVIALRFGSSPPQYFDVISTWKDTDGDLFLRKTTFLSKRDYCL